MKACYREGHWRAVAAILLLCLATPCYAHHAEAHVDPAKLPAVTPPVVPPAARNNEMESLLKLPVFPFGNQLLPTDVSGVGGALGRARGLKRLIGGYPSPLEPATQRVAADQRFAFTGIWIGFDSLKPVSSLPGKSGDYVPVAFKKFAPDPDDLDQICSDCDRTLPIRGKSLLRGFRLPGLKRAQHSSAPPRAVSEEREPLRDTAKVDGMLRGRIKLEKIADGAAARKQSSATQIDSPTTDAVGKARVLHYRRRMLADAAAVHVLQRQDAKSMFKQGRVEHRTFLPQRCSKVPMFMPTIAARYLLASKEELNLEDGAVMVRAGDWPVYVNCQVGGSTLQARIARGALALVALLDGKLTVANFTDSCCGACMVYARDQKGNLLSAQVGAGGIAQYVPADTNADLALVACTQPNRAIVVEGLAIESCRMDYVRAIRRYNLKSALTRADLDRVLKTAVAYAFVRSSRY